MTSVQARMAMPDAKREVRFEHYVRTQFMGEDGYTEPVSNVSEEHWSPLPTRDPHDYAEALAVCLELHHEDHEVKFRVWVETWIRR